MRPQISKRHDVAEAKQEAEAGMLPKLGTKQAVAHVRHCDADGKSVDWYTLEDGTEVMKDRAGKTVTKWIDE